MDGELRQSCWCGRAALAAVLQADGTPDTETIGCVHTLGGEELCCDEGHTSPLILFIFFILLEFIPVLLFFSFQFTIYIAHCVELEVFLTV